MDQGCIFLQHLLGQVYQLSITEKIPNRSNLQGRMVFFDLWLLGFNPWSFDPVALGQWQCSPSWLEHKAWDTAHSVFRKQSRKEPESQQPIPVSYPRGLIPFSWLHLLTLVKSITGQSILPGLGDLHNVRVPWTRKESDVTG